MDFQVVGVLKKEGNSLINIFSFDEAVLISFNTAKKLIYANDTSGTMPSSRPKRAESTRISLEDYENSEQFLINESNSNNNDRLTTNGFDVWKWVIDHGDSLTAPRPGKEMIETKVASCKGRAPAVLVAPAEGANLIRGDHGG